MSELLIRNPHVYTVDPVRPWAESVSIRDGRIEWLGEDDDAGNQEGPDTEVIDAAGATVLSGNLFDAVEEDPRRLLDDDLHVASTIVDGQVIHST